MAPPKGFIPWNKGKKGVMPTPWNKGKICPQISAMLKGKKLPQASGENHWMYRQGRIEEFKKSMLGNKYALGVKWDDARREKDRLTRKKGVESKGWKGGRLLIKGYVYIYMPNHPNKVLKRYIREHRYVMEKHLGRYLFPWEVVHHINGITTDNRLENLQLLPNGEHNTKVQEVYQENIRLKEKLAKNEDR